MIEDLRTNSRTVCAHISCYTTISLGGIAYGAIREEPYAPSGTAVVMAFPLYQEENETLSFGRFQAVYVKLPAKTSQSGRGVFQYQMSIGEIKQQMLEEDSVAGLPDG